MCFLKLNPTNQVSLDQKEFSTFLSPRGKCFMVGSTSILIVSDVPNFTVNVVLLGPSP